MSVKLYTAVGEPASPAKRETWRAQSIHAVRNGLPYTSSSSGTSAIVAMRMADGRIGVWEGEIVATAWVSLHELSFVAPTIEEATD